MLFRDSSMILDILLSSFEIADTAFTSLGILEVVPISFEIADLISF